MSCREALRERLVRLEELIKVNASWDNRKKGEEYREGKLIV